MVALLQELPLGKFELTFIPASVSITSAFYLYITGSATVVVCMCDSLSGVTYVWIYPYLHYKMLQTVYFLFKIHVRFRFIFSLKMSRNLTNGKSLNVFKPTLFKWERKNWSLRKDNVELKRLPAQNTLDCLPNLIWKQGENEGEIGTCRHVVESKASWPGWFWVLCNHKRGRWLSHLDN